MLPSEMVKGSKLFIIQNNPDSDADPKDPLHSAESRSEINYKNPNPDPDLNLAQLWNMLH